MQFFRSTIGLKIQMAVTGVILLGWVMAHLAGNMQAFAGAETFNKYAAMLHDNPPILWGQRVVFWAAVVGHIRSFVLLKGRSDAARPVAYTGKGKEAGTAFARAMRVTGVLIALFLVIHLDMFTLGIVTKLGPDKFANLVNGFQGGLGMALVAFYVAVMAMLWGHLRHGIWSVFQTLGLNHPNANVWRDRLALVMPTLITLGFSTIPLGIALGLIK